MTDTLLANPEWLRANMKGAAAVDREKHIISGVILAEEGPFKSQGRGEFDRAAIRSIVKMANERPAGLKSRFAHPGLSSDGIGTMLGRMKGAYTEKIMRETGTDESGRPMFKEVLAAKADLHLSPTSFETPNGNLGKYVEDLAAEDPDAFGTSLVLQVNQEYRLDKQGKPLKDDNGDDLPPLWIPTKLHASDVVDDGDATRSFLSADILASLPDGIVRQGCQLLDAQFAGQAKDVIRARLSAFIDRYLSYRFGDDDDMGCTMTPPPAEPEVTAISSEPAPAQNDDGLSLECWLLAQED